jgi:NAD-dependent DNA ligase
VRFHDLKEVAFWIGYVLYPEWNKEWRKHSSFNVVNKSSIESGFLPSMSERQYARLKTATTFPCMGYTRALAAAKHFSSIREMVNASAEEWRQIEGIGKTVSKAVVDYVT